MADAFAAWDEERPEWRDAIAQATQILDSAPNDLTALRPYDLTHEVEKALTPLAAVAKTFTIHCVGHGHIDMNWMWSWPETVAATHDTFASVLSLMRTYPELTYSQSQASVYALIEKYHPTMFEEIRERVKEGRWEVTATQWVEGDKNLVNGESLIGHYLYTRQYFAEKFGLTPEDVPVQWEPDTFGHANTIPMIARMGGVKYYYACRLGGGFGHERVGDERPPLFWWESPDGSRILVNKEISWYNSYVNIGDNIALPALKFFQANGIREWLNVYGIGNHGGGPTRREIDYYEEMRDWPIYPHIAFSTSKRFFESLPEDKLADLPILDHELNFEFTGCYTSQSLIKQANRLGENACLEAEALVSLASGPILLLRGERVGIEGNSPTNGPETTRRLRGAWLNVLFNQFHDILPGSGVRETREHARALFQETAAITSSLKREAMKTIADLIDTLALLPDTPEGREERASWSPVPEESREEQRWDSEGGQVSPPKGGGAQGDYESGAGLGAGSMGHSRAGGGGAFFKPVVIFNPSAWEREDVVTVSLWDTDFDASLIVALDEAGVRHPTFFVEKKEEWGHVRMTVMFHATVPGLGYRTYLLCEGLADSPGGITIVDGETVESSSIRVKFDRYEGGLNGVTSLATGHEFGWGGLGTWQKHTEQPRMMTSWVLGGNRAVEQIPAKRFDLEGEDRNVATLQASGSTLLGFGVHVHEISSSGSQAVVKAMVHSRKPRVEFTADLDWREIGSDQGIPGLAVHFHDSYDDSDEGNSPTLFETPFGSIVRSTMNEAPMLRWHFSKSRHEEHGITLLSDGKSSCSQDSYCRQLRVIRSSFDPDPMPEVNQQTFRYGLHFHETPPTTAELMRLGIEFNHPLIVHPATFHSGEAPPFGGFLSCASPNVVVSSVRPAQDEKGWVVQLVEADGEAGEALLVGDFESAELVDAMERPLGIEGRRTEAGISVPIGAFQAVGVRVWLS